MAEKINECLHCAIMATVNEWFEAHGERREGVVVFDVVEAISKLQECAAAVAEMPADRASRRRAGRFALDALKAAIEAERAGTLISVDIPAVH